MRHLCDFACFLAKRVLSKPDLLNHHTQCSPYEIVTTIS
jgi:hypothetical protein